RRLSSVISSGRRDACARWDISVGLSENSVNSCGSLALRNTQMRCPRASANWHRSRSVARSEEHTSELQSLRQLVCRLLLEKKDFRHMGYPVMSVSQALDSML